MGRLLDIVIAIVTALSLHAGGFMLSDWHGANLAETPAIVDVSQSALSPNHVEAIVEAWEDDISSLASSMVDAQMSASALSLPTPEFDALLLKFVAVEPMRRPSNLSAPKVERVAAPAPQKANDKSEEPKKQVETTAKPSAKKASEPAKAQPVNTKPAKANPAPGLSKKQVAALQQSYAGAVRNAIAKKLRAPKGVAGGRVKVAVNLENGRLVGLGLAASSGNAALDKAALSAAKSARYPKPPKGLTGVQKFVLPISVQ